MPSDLRPGPYSVPTDELHAAEDTLGVLQRVLHTIAADDLSRPIGPLAQDFRRK